MDARSDVPQPLGPVVHRIHPGDDREQDLRGADVRRRLLTTNVLLARGQGETKRHPIMRVLRDTDEPAGHRSLVGVTRRHVGRMRAAVEERDAETLRAADHDVDTHLPRRRQQRQGERIGGDGDQYVAGRQPGDEAAVVPHLTVCARILEEDSKRVVLDQVGDRVADGHLDAERLCTRVHDFDGLRVTCRIDEEPGAILLVDSGEHRHRLGRRRGLVEEGGVGDLHPGEVDDHGLEVEQRLEPPLRDLGLIRRVRRVPAGIFEDVALDDPRRDRVRVAGADHRRVDGVLGGEATQPAEYLGLGRGCGETDGRLVVDRRGHRLDDEVVECPDADRLEHRCNVIVPEAVVTCDE